MLMLMHAQAIAGELHRMLDWLWASLGQQTATLSFTACTQAACKDAEVLPHLLATVQQSQSPEVQLLAAQTLRKHVPRDWRRLSSQVCCFDQLHGKQQHPHPCHAHSSMFHLVCIMVTSC